MLYLETCAENEGLIMCRNSEARVLTVGVCVCVCVACGVCVWHVVCVFGVWCVCACTLHVWYLTAAVSGT